MAITKSNSIEALDGSHEYAIGIYLRKGEVKEAMLKKFNGNKTELVVFLRNRELEQYNGSTYIPDFKDAERVWKEESARIAEARQIDLIKFNSQPVKKKRAKK